MQWEDGTIVSYGAGTMFVLNRDGERSPRDNVASPRDTPHTDADVGQRTHLGVTLLV